MKFLTPSLAILGCVIIGGIWFKTTTPSRCDAIRDDDTIFVLTGDARRIPFAMRQIASRPNSDLYIIGAGAPHRPAMPRVTVESASRSTYQNAMAIREITYGRDLNRIVLITTEDHMNRAMYLVRGEIPGIEIIACTVPLRGLPAPRRLTRWATEYIKYVVTLFGIKES